MQVTCLSELHRQYADATATSCICHSTQTLQRPQADATTTARQLYTTARGRHRDSTCTLQRPLSNWGTKSLPRRAVCQTEQRRLSRTTTEIYSSCERTIQQPWMDETATANGRDSDRKLKLQWPRMDAKDKANGRHSDHNRTLEQPQADATATVKGRCSDRHQTPLSIATSSGRYSNSQRIDIRCISLVNLLTRDIGSSVNHAHCQPRQCQMMTLFAQYGILHFAPRRKHCTAPGV